MSEVSVSNLVRSDWLQDVLISILQFYWLQYWLQLSLSLFTIDLVIFISIDLFKIPGGWNTIQILLDGITITLCYIITSPPSVNLLSFVHRSQFTIRIFCFCHTIFFLVLPYEFSFVFPYESVFWTLFLLLVFSSLYVTNRLPYTAHFRPYFNTNFTLYFWYEFPVCFIRTFTLYFRTNFSSFCWCFRLYFLRSFLLSFATNKIAQTYYIASIICTIFSHEFLHVFWHAVPLKTMILIVLLVLFEFFDAKPILQCLWLFSLLADLYFHWKLFCYCHQLLSYVFSN